MNLATVISEILNPGLAMLPANMDSVKARVLLLAMGLQESRFEHVRQIGGGPGRGYWQFEPGTKASRGGAWGIFLHRASAPHLEGICRRLDIPFDPHSIWLAIERDQVFACVCARLLAWTGPALPEIDDVQGAWEFYAEDVWRPGAPRPQTWPAYHQQARAALGV